LRLLAGNAMYTAMRIPALFAAVVSCTALIGGNTARAAGTTELTWYGHAAFKIVTPGGKTILVDPWISNPTNKSAKEDLAKLDKADLILISHGHFDHVGDAVAIAKKTNAKLVATFDLGGALVHNGFPASNYGFDTAGNFGGELTLLDGEVKVAFIPAVHSSTVVANPDTPNEQRNYGGAPSGFLITIKDGPSIYHTGDTDLFSDMSLIPHFHKVNVMLACIGDHFTMGPERAAEAVKLVNPVTVVPMHFATFPMFTGTPDAFGKALKAKNVKAQLRVMKVGESLKL
jgi:L-ascorbate metabolism protein UlaG (beta-lactamase superfamily)